MPAPSAVVIGINYTTWPPGVSADVITRAGRNPLRAAEADAQAVAAGLRGQGYSVTAQIGVEATRAAILDALEAATTANPDGARLFYFAGHGELDPYNSQAAYLLPADADPYSLYLTAIPLDDLVRRYLGERGTVLAVFDTCPAGPDPILSSSATAGMGAQFGQRAADTFAHGPGRTVLAACADDPATREPPPGDHGALTAALLAYWAQHPGTDPTAVADAVAAAVERGGHPRPAAGGLPATPAAPPAVTPPALMHTAPPPAPADLTPPSLAGALPLNYLPKAAPALEKSYTPADLPPASATAQAELSVLPRAAPSDPASEVAALLGNVETTPEAPPPPAPPPAAASLPPAPPPVAPPVRPPPPTWAPPSRVSGPVAPPAPPPARPDTFTWPGEYGYKPTPPPPPPRPPSPLRVVWILGGLILGVVALISVCAWVGQATEEANATATAETARDEATETAAAAAVATRTAVAQATQAHQAAATATALAPRAVLTFGPQDGKLVHSSNNLIPTGDSAVELSNFVVSALFTNPYGTDAGTWDYGFLFRSTGDNQEYRLMVLSSGQWRLQLVAQPAPPPTDTPASGAGLLPTPTAESLAESAFTLIDQGDAPWLNTGEIATNELRLVANGGSGWLFVNGQPIGPLDLSAKLDAGDIEIGTGFYADDVIPGKATSYSKFTVWALP